MHVMKLGGTSLGNAARLRAAAELVRAEGRRGPVLAVVSAVAGVTDALVEAGHAAAFGAAVEPWIDRFWSLHAGLVNELGAELAEPARLLTELSALSAELGRLLRGFALLGEARPVL